MKLSLAVAFATALALSACASTETIIATQAVTLSCTYVKSTTVEKAAGGLEVEVPTTITVTKTATTAEDAAEAIQKVTDGKPCTQVAINTAGAGR